VIEVYLDNSECSDFAAADAWAKSSCVGYLGVGVRELKDYYYPDADEVAVYSFNNSADAAFFTMTWKAVR
jgi:hypothetical protein